MSEELLMQLLRLATNRIDVHSDQHYELYDYNQMKANMDLTYPNRRRLVREMKPIKEIVDLYSGFCVHDLVSS